MSIYPLKKENPVFTYRMIDKMLIYKFYFYLRH